MWMVVWDTARKRDIEQLHGSTNHKYAERAQGKECHADAAGDAHLVTMNPIERRRSDESDEPGNWQLGPPVLHSVQKAHQALE